MTPPDPIEPLIVTAGRRAEPFVVRALVTIALSLGVVCTVINHVGISHPSCVLTGNRDPVAILVQLHFGPRLWLGGS